MPSTCQSTQEAVELPRVQFIDNLVGDPTVMQRQVSTIQSAQHPDVTEFMLDTDDPRHSAVGQDDSDELNEELARENMKRTPKKAANGSDRERFKDLVLPSSQSCFTAAECSMLPVTKGETKSGMEIQKVGRGEDKRSGMGRGRTSDGRLALHAFLCGCFKISNQTPFCYEILDHWVGLRASNLSFVMTAHCVCYGCCL